MQTRKGIARRIRILYVIFFVALAGSIFFTAYGTAFLTGVRDASGLLGSQAGGSGITDRLYFFSVSNDTHLYDFEIPVRGAGGEKIAARIESVDLIMDRQDAEKYNKTPLVLSEVFFWLSVISYLGVVIVIFLLLNTVRRSLKTEIIFARKTVKLTRLVGILLICASVLSSLFLYFEYSFLHSVIADPHLTVDKSLTFNFPEIVVGIIILFIAEVFAIGNELSEELKLTV